MKLRNFFFAALAAVLVSVGCEKEQDGGSGGKAEKPLTQLKDIQAAGTFSSMGTIAAVAKNYYILTDGTANIAVYTSDVELKLGDKVLVEGSVQRGSKSYETEALQFASPTCTVISSGNTVAHSPVEYDGQMIEAALGGTCSCPDVTFKGLFFKSGTYYNIYVKGTSKQAGFYYQNEGSWDEWDGKNVIVKAYLIYQYNYFNVVPYDVVEDPNPAPFIATISESELNFTAQGGEKTITVTTTTDSGWELSATSSNAAFSTAVQGNVITVTAGEATELTNAKLTIELKAGGNVVDSYTVPLSQAAPLEGGQIEAVIDFTQKGYENQTAISSVQEGTLNLSFSAGSNSNGPKYYTSGTAVRLYGGNSVTITGGTISYVKFTFGSGEDTNDILPSEGEYDGTAGTWSGSATSLTFTIDGTKGNRRIQKMTIVYLPDSAAGEPAKAARNLAFSKTSVSTVLGEVFVAPTLSGTTDGVVYSSSNAEVATVDATGAVTILALGTTTITAAAEENDTHLAGTASYTLNVLETAPAGPQVVTVAEFLAAAEDDTEYQLTGVIKDTYNTTFGNFYLEDATERVCVYGLTATKQSSNDRSFASLGLRDGDTVTLVGKRSSHNGTAQVGGPAYYVSHVAAPYVDVPATATVNSAATTYTIEVKSNTSWTATPSTGVTLDKTSGNGNASVVMTFPANTVEEVCKYTVEFTYQESNVTFELTQRAVAANGEIVVFEESFTTATGNAGWDGTSGNGEFKSDNEGWAVENAYGAGGSAKFGKSSGAGKATTPALSFTGTATLTFKAGAWNNDNENTTLKLSMTGGTLSQASVTLKKGEWTEYEVEITNATEGAKITFESNVASKNRFFLDDIKVVQAQ